jgi:pantoate--beta-alanine ligase
LRLIFSQPDNTYFGQKDIQQALLLKRLCRDLLLAYPAYHSLHIVPTVRDPTDGLALSSRNLYLSSDGRKVAQTLRQALVAAETAWYTGSTTSECLELAEQVIKVRRAQASSEGLQVQMKVDYIQMNDADTFDVLSPYAQRPDDDSRGVILSGALYVDKTRLIDNILLGDAKRLLE